MAALTTYSGPRPEVCSMACIPGRINCAAGCCSCDQNGNPVPQPPPRPFTCPAGHIVSPDGQYCCPAGQQYDPRQTGCVPMTPSTPIPPTRALGPIHPQDQEADVCGGVSCIPGKMSCAAGCCACDTPIPPGVATLGTNVSDNSWMWWTAGGIILLLLLVLVWALAAGAGSPRPPPPVSQL